VHDLGKLLAPEADWCAVTKNIVRARATRRCPRWGTDP